MSLYTTTCRQPILDLPPTVLPKRLYRGLRKHRPDRTRIAVQVDVIPAYNASLFRENKNQPQIHPAR